MFIVTVLVFAQFCTLSLIAVDFCLILYIFHAVFTYGSKSPFHFCNTVFKIYSVAGNFWLISTVNLSINFSCPGSIYLVTCCHKLLNILPLLSFSSYFKFFKGSFYWLLSIHWFWFVKFSSLHSQNLRGPIWGRPWHPSYVIPYTSSKHQYYCLIQ